MSKAKKEQEFCVIKECNETAYMRNVCRYHYYSVYKKKLNEVFLEKNYCCVYENCDKPIVSHSNKMYCKTHEKCEPVSVQNILTTHEVVSITISDIIPIIEKELKNSRVPVQIGSGQWQRASMHKSQNRTNFKPVFVSSFNNSLLIERYVVNYFLFSNYSDRLMNVCGGGGYGARSDLLAQSQYQHYLYTVHAGDNESVKRKFFTKLTFEESWEISEICWNEILKTMKGIKIDSKKYKLEVKSGVTKNIIDRMSNINRKDYQGLHIPLTNKKKILITTGKKFQLKNGKIITMSSIDIAYQEITHFTYGHVHHPNLILYACDGGGYLQYMSDNVPGKLNLYFVPFKTKILSQTEPNSSHISTRLTRSAKENLSNESQPSVPNTNTTLTKAPRPSFRVSFRKVATKLQLKDGCLERVLQNQKDRPFKCKNKRNDNLECDAAYTTKDDLHEHQRMRCPMVQYPLTYCTKHRIKLSFKTPSQLKYHNRVHHTKHVPTNGEKVMLEKKINLQETGNKANKLIKKVKKQKK